MAEFEPKNENQFGWINVGETQEKRIIFEKEDEDMLLNAGWLLFDAIDNRDGKILHYLYPPGLHYIKFIHYDD